MTNKKGYKNEDISIYGELSERDKKTFLSKFNEQFKETINSLLKYKKWDDLRIDIYKDSQFFKGPNLSKSNGYMYCVVWAEKGDGDDTNYEQIDEKFSLIGNHNKFI